MWFKERSKYTLSDTIGASIKVLLSDLYLKCKKFLKIIAIKVFLFKCSPYIYTIIKTSKINIMALSTLQKIATVITIEQLIKILDKIELHPNQRKDLKEEVVCFGAHSFVLENEALVVMNNEEFKRFY